MITVERAEDLSAVDTCAALVLGNDLRTTHMVYKTSTPVWDKTFELYVNVCDAWVCVCDMCLCVAKLKTFTMFWRSVCTKLIRFKGKLNFPYTE